MCNYTVSNNWPCQLHNATLISDQSHSWSTLIQMSVLPEDVSLRVDPLSLLSRSTTTWSHTVEMCRYLVIPHADVGPDVVVDYRLLFIFRLQTHKIKFLTGWSSCCFWSREMFSSDTVSAHRTPCQQQCVCVYTVQSLQACVVFYYTLMDEQSMDQLH